MRAHASPAPSLAAPPRAAAPSRRAPPRATAAGAPAAGARLLLLPRRPRLAPRLAASSDDSSGPTVAEDAGALHDDPAPPPGSRFADVTDADELRAEVSALRAVDIREDLRGFGVNTAGVKSQLVDRLVDCYAIKMDGGDPRAVLKQRTESKRREIEAEKAASLARRDARRKRRGAYEMDPDAARRRHRAVARPRAVRGVARVPPKGAPRAPPRAPKFVADVVEDDELEGDPDSTDKYKLHNAVTGRRKLNVARRDLDLQHEFQNQMGTSAGEAGEAVWYLVEVPENREEKAVSQILALNGRAEKVGENAPDIEAWIPRAAPSWFTIPESAAEGKSRVDVLRLVPEVDDVTGEPFEKPFMGFVLLKLALNPTMLASLDDLYAFKGFAVSGVTQYGSTARQVGERPAEVPAEQLAVMMDACEGFEIVSDEEHERRVKARVLDHERAKEEAASEGKPAEGPAGGVYKASEAPRGGLNDDDVRGEDASEEDPERYLRSGGGGGEEEGDDAEVREGDGGGGGAEAQDGALEVRAGPFKGFRGFVTARLEDGRVEATLSIFGRETDVVLEPEEFQG